jgi:carbon-monoxide dehydrogenase small subunit
MKDQSERVYLRLNGEDHEIEVQPNQLLLDVLRDRLSLKGARRGCGDNICGACTVLLDGMVVHSCSVLAVQASGHEILTIEGLAQGATLHPIQEAFIQEGALQCGYCTPGMILAAKALLDSSPRPSPSEIRFALTGNLCRCTGYSKIVAAVLAASRQNI